MKKSEEKRATIFAISQSYLKHDSMYVVRSDKSIIRFTDLFTSGGRQNIRSKNLYIQRKNIAPRRSKHLALETVREGNALNGAVEME